MDGTVDLRSVVDINGSYVMWTLPPMRRTHQAGKDVEASEARGSAPEIIAVKHAGI
jgi:hypothetical protein